jgi:hypothetical protein
MPILIGCPIRHCSCSGKKMTRYVGVSAPRSAHIPREMSPVSDSNLEANWCSHVAVVKSQRWLLVTQTWGAVCDPRSVENCVVAQADFTLVQNFYFFVTRRLTKMCNTNSSCNSSSNNNNNNIIVKSKKDRICLLIDIASNTIRCKCNTKGGWEDIKI